MLKDEVDLLAIARGSIVAPAGCGKTHQIARTLARHADAKPVLVLTHTNAGVVALRSRLDAAQVPPRHYRLATIDGWAMRLISTFPSRSAADPKTLDLADARRDYPEIRRAAALLLKGGHIDDLLSATYARLIVDEYQDCSLRQHALIVYASRTLPTCVLGDPLQAIFGFGGDGLANWAKEVCIQFPPSGELSTPWRWINAGAEMLGTWLLDVRRRLMCGDAIDLSAAPENVTWIELDGTQDHKRKLAAASKRPPTKDGCTLIIGESKNPESQRQFASQIPGAVTVEAVDLKDLISFSKELDIKSTGALSQLASFAQRVMTGTGAADLVRRVESIRRCTARKPPNYAEQAALLFVANPSHQRAVDVLVEIGRQPGVRTHRPALLRTSIKALNLCDGPNCATFYDAAVRIREQNRLVGRPLPRRAVGSTLLLKGLEADAAVILDADGMDANNLYVAMTRGSRSLTICSSRAVLDGRSMVP